MNCLVLWILSLLMYNFVTSCIGHLEDINMSYANIPNTDLLNMKYMYINHIC